MPKTTRHVASARGRQAAVLYYQAERPHGAKLRPSPDQYDLFANGYQRELVSAYDVWAKRTDGVVARAVEDGLSQQRIEGILEARLQDLEFDLVELGNRKLGEAAGLGIGRRLSRHIDKPGVRATLARMQERNAGFIRESLIPDLQTRLLRAAGEARSAQTLELRGQLLMDGFDAFRARVASYSGGAVVTTFEVQAAAGRQENLERASRGEPTVPVKWNLDPRAQHCEDSPDAGRQGCPSFAGVYQGGWDALPTVPAGERVTCLGSCRCWISADFGSGWELL